MYAIVVSGGKQHKVSIGDSFLAEYLDGEVGTAVVLDQVLMLVGDNNTIIGQPYIEGCKVETEIADQIRAKKVEIVKFKRRKHYMRHQGHRHCYTKLTVKNISAAEK